MSKATEGDDRHPYPGVIHDDWKMPRPGSVTLAATGYGKTYTTTYTDTDRHNGEEGREHE